MTLLYIFSASFIDWLPLRESLSRSIVFTRLPSSETLNGSSGASLQTHPAVWNLLTHRRRTKSRSLLLQPFSLSAYHTSQPASNATRRTTRDSIENHACNDKRQAQVGCETHIQNRTVTSHSHPNSRSDPPSNSSATFCETEQNWLFVC